MVGGVGVCVCVRVYVYVCDVFQQSTALFMHHQVASAGVVGEKQYEEEEQQQLAHRSHTAVAAESEVAFPGNILGREVRQQTRTSRTQQGPCHVENKVTRKLPNESIAALKKAMGDTVLEEQQVMKLSFVPFH